MIRIKIDARDLVRFSKKLAKVAKEMPKETATAMNKALTTTSPEAAGMVSSIYNVGTPSLDVKKANAGSLTGHIKGSGGMLPVSQFDPHEEGGRVVSVVIKRGSRKPIMSSGVGRGAFMTGDGKVMERRQDEKYPVFPVSTIGIPQMLGSKAISNPIRDKMAEIIMSELPKKIFNKL